MDVTNRLQTDFRIIFYLSGWQKLWQKSIIMNLLIYLYVRVSTDEQKRKGYSLVEKDDRLIKHCEMHGIEIKGIYH